MSNDPSDVEIIDDIPDPQTIRDLIRQNVERTTVLRSMLRLALRKAALRREAASREGVLLAQHGR
jgi:hypothetical protein